MQTDRDVTRIIVRPAQGVRASALLATLVDKLQPTLKINVVFYLAVFALPSAASGWINAYGFAFLAPTTSEERNRLTESFLAKFVEHMGGPGVVAYQEDQFFILSVEGDVPDSFDEEGLSLQEVAAHAEGVNIALVIGIASMIDRPFNRKTAIRMRRQVATL